MGTNIFEKASRRKLLFETSKGSINVESLWDVPLIATNHKTRFSLDEIAKSLHRELKNMEEESFVVSKNSTASKAKETTELRFAIVKHIIGVKLAEREKRELDISNRLHKEKILDILESKKDAALADLSVEELEKMAQSI